MAAVVDAAYRAYIIPGSTADSAGIKITRAYAETYETNARTLAFYNGSRAGSVASYAVDRLAALYSVATDVLLVSYGHNYGTGTVADYEAALDELCHAFRAAHPEAGIVVCSQNPEYAPVAGGTIAAHRSRNAALRRYAARNGYAYLPVAEMYASQPDTGQSWVQTDGVHPKTTSHAADPNNGSYQTAALLRDYLDGLSLA